MSGAETARHHDTIRGWVEKRGGYPAVVKATENEPPGGGLLRIDYDEPDGNDDIRLERIGWNEFFRIFDANELAFVYDPDANSRFSKLVANETTHN